MRSALLTGGLVAAVLALLFLPALKPRGKGEASRHTAETAAALPTAETPPT